MMVKHRSIWIGGGLMAALVLTLGLLLRNETGRATTPRADVASSQLPPARPAILAALGVVEPHGGLVDLAPAMPGVLTMVHVVEGQAVRRGEVLAELANEDLKAKLDQARAVLAIRKAQFDLIVNGPRQEEIQKAEAQLREEEINVDLLRLQFERRQALFRSGSVSAEAFNEIGSRLAASQERHRALSHSVSILRQGARREEVEAARGEVRFAESMVREAQANLDKSYIRASRDGLVLRRYREPGEALSLQPVVPVLQIADVSAMVVRAQIDETDALSVGVGQTVRMTAAALGGRYIRGRIERISPRLGAKTITAEIPTEKRDTRVLDVIITFHPDEALPVNLRLDVFVDPDARRRLGSFRTGNSRSGIVTRNVATHSARTDRETL